MIPLLPLGLAALVIGLVASTRQTGAPASTGRQRTGHLLGSGPPVYLLEPPTSAVAPSADAGWLSSVVATLYAVRDGVWVRAEPGIPTDGERSGFQVPAGFPVKLLGAPAPSGWRHVEVTHPDHGDLRGFVEATDLGPMAAAAPAPSPAMQTTTTTGARVQPRVQSTGAPPQLSRAQIIAILRKQGKTKQSKGARLGQKLRDLAAKPKRRG